MGKQRRGEKQCRELMADQEGKHLLLQGGNISEHLKWAEKAPEEAEGLHIQGGDSGVLPALLWLGFTASPWAGDSSRECNVTQGWELELWLQLGLPGHHTPQSAKQTQQGLPQVRETQGKEFCHGSVPCSASFSEIITCFSLSSFPCFLCPSYIKSIIKWHLFPYLQSCSSAHSLSHYLSMSFLPHVFFFSLKGKVDSKTRIQCNEKQRAG